MEKQPKDSNVISWRKARQRTSRGKEGPRQKANGGKLLDSLTPLEASKAREEGWSKVRPAGSLRRISSHLCT